MTSGQSDRQARARWEHFYHMADVGVRGFGENMGQAFEQAALALTAVVTEPEQVRAEQAVEIGCAAPNDELLLTDWLNALVFEMATRRMLFARFEVTIEDHRLTARAWLTTGASHATRARAAPTAIARSATRGAAPSPPRAPRRPGRGSPPASPRARRGSRGASRPRRAP